MQNTTPEMENRTIPEAVSASTENVTPEQTAPARPRRSRMERRLTENLEQEAVTETNNSISPAKEETEPALETPSATPPVLEAVPAAPPADPPAPADINSLLIRCPACNKEVSKAVRRCPFCGHPLKTVNLKKLIVIVSVVVFVLCLIGGAYYFFVQLPKQIPIKAHEYLLQGDFVSADKMYAKLGNSDENILTRAQLYYESRILQAAKAEQESLIFPDTMILSEVVIWEKEEVDKSSGTQEVYTYPEPEILLHYLAQSKGGSMVDGYVRINWKDGAYIAGLTVDDLQASNTLPWYIDQSTREGLQAAVDFWDEQVEKSGISIDLVTRKSIGVFDLNRCNEILKATLGKETNLIPSGDVIVTPSPRIVEVTPKP